MTLDQIYLYGLCGVSLKSPVNWPWPIKLFHLDDSVGIHANKANDQQSRIGIRGTLHQYESSHYSWIHSSICADWVVRPGGRSDPGLSTAILRCSQAPTLWRLVHVCREIWCSLQIRAPRMSRVQKLDKLLLCGVSEERRINNAYHHQRRWGVGHRHQQSRLIWSLHTTQTWIRIHLSPPSLPFAWVNLAYSPMNITYIHPSLYSHLII